jgi:hypothetical protein
MIVVMARWLALVVLVACTPAPREPEADPCALGIDPSKVEPRVATLLVRRTLACNDHRYHRITDEEYRALAEKIDAALAGERQVAKRPQNKRDRDASGIVWASSVLDVSSQYSDDSWAAKQVLGPPDVFPAYGDNGKAWASKGPDDQAEWIEVEFDHPGSVSSVEVFETFNPGAIDKIELTTSRGHTIDVPLGGPAPAPGVSAHRTFKLRCTRETIASAKIHLDSQNVAGWNEIDAIGVVSCVP